MTDSALRAAIDAAIRAHLDRRGDSRLGDGPPPPDTVAASAGTPRAHAGEEASHARFGGNRLADDPPPGQCVIEPSVECVHCNYCRSQGF